MPSPNTDTPRHTCSSSTLKWTPALRLDTAEAAIPIPFSVQRVTTWESTVLEVLSCLLFCWFFLASVGNCGCWLRWRIPALRLAVALLFFRPLVLAELLVFFAPDCGQSSGLDGLVTTTCLLGDGLGDGRTVVWNFQYR